MALEGANLILSTCIFSYYPFPYSACKRTAGDHIQRISADGTVTCKRGYEYLHPQPVCNGTTQVQVCTPRKLGIFFPVVNIYFIFYFFMKVHIPAGHLFLLIRAAVLRTVLSEIHNATQIQASPELVVGCAHWNPTVKSAEPCPGYGNRYVCTWPLSRVTGVIKNQS